MALFNAKEIFFEDGERLNFIDYQFPLKSVRADKDIGKIDLLGVFENGMLAVVELKVEANREDRRIGLIESLIYAAIIEANLPKIAAEVAAMHERRIAPVRPKILIVAPSRFWSNTDCYPSDKDMSRLVTDVSEAVPIDIGLLHLKGADTLEKGLDGSKPALAGLVSVAYIQPGSM